MKWYCKYQVVFVPKYRRRAIYESLRKQVGGILRDLCQQQGVEIVEGHAMPDHIHLCLSIRPKYSVANTTGLLKGKSAIRIHRECLGHKLNFTGRRFWARGYCVSTVGLDEQTIVRYIRNQEAEEKRLEQMQLKGLYTLSSDKRPPPGAFIKPPPLGVVADLNIIHAYECCLFGGRLVM